MEEEDFTSKEADNEQSATEAFNIMQMIKDESAEKNVKVYIISAIFLGKWRRFQNLLHFTKFVNLDKNLFYLSNFPPKV